MTRQISTNKKLKLFSQRIAHHETIGAVLARGTCKTTRAKGLKWPGINALGVLP